MIEQYHGELEKLDLQLGDASLYEDSTQQNKLNQLVEKRAQAHSSLAQVEEEWLEISETLEDLT